jgi:hypothetical protein
MHSNRSGIVAVALVVCGAGALGACGGKKDDKGGDKGGANAKADPQAELKAVADKAVADVNGKIPEELKGKVEFTAVLGEKEHHVAVQPKGWETTAISGTVRPPDAAGLGFMTQYSTGSNCDGSCEPKDWAATADKVDFAQFKGQDFTVQKDEKLDSGRLMVAKTVDHTYVVAAQWKDGAKRYYVCRATLDQEIAAAVPAFEAACRAMKVVEW